MYENPNLKKTEFIFLFTEGIPIDTLKKKNPNFYLWAFKIKWVTLNLRDLCQTVLSDAHLQLSFNNQAQLQ